MSLQYSLFPTAFGHSALVWSEAGIRAVIFPEKSKKLALTHLKSRFPAASLAPQESSQTKKAIKALQSHFSGAQQDFSKIRLDLEVQPAFLKRVYQEAQKIPAGQTVSYKELATRAGSPKAARAVGQAMAKNPYMLLVPCHRVLSSQGKLTGFSAPGGLETKKRLLLMEGTQWGKLGSTVKKKQAPAWEFDPKIAVKKLTQQDPKLGKVMQKVGPFTLEPSKLSSPFEALLRSIVFQQLAGKAAATILNRVLALYGGSYPTPEELLKTKPTKLLAAGLSKNKTLALQDLAAKTVEGIVPSIKQLSKMPDLEIIERLSSIRGVGRWTVEMMLIFRLGRPDVLAVDDYALRKAVQKIYALSELPSKKQMLMFGERWAPYRTVASWYLWRSLDIKPI